MGSKEEEYKEMFLAEALDNYEELNNLFTKLEKNTSNKKVIDHIFRITHTLKGNAMGMGFEAIAELGHVMEDIFSEVKAGKIELDDDLFNSLFKANDKLGHLIDAIKTGKKVNYKGIRTKLAVYLKNAKSEVEPPKEKEISIPKESQNKDVEASLFDRIGGKDAIDAAVQLFYNKVLVDETIKHFFESVEMNKQIAKQRAFLSYAFGGPVKYTGKDMRTAHFKMGLNEEHFNSVAGHLAATLEELKIAPELINEVIEIALSVKDDVLAGGEETKAESKKEEKAKVEPKPEAKTKKTQEDDVKPLFDRIGGKEAVDAAVELFYDKIISDETIKHFFEGVDMKQQIAKQRTFLAYAFGGPVKYTGKDMRSAHTELVKKGLNGDHFNAVAGHLVATLEELKITPELIDEVVKIALSVKDDVLGREEGKQTNQKVESEQKTASEEVKPTIEEEIQVEEQEVEEAISELVKGNKDELAEEEDEEDDDEAETKVAFSDLVQVPVRKLDGLLNLVGELIIERDTLIAASTERGYGTNMFARLQRITSDLQYGVMDVRLVQIGFLFSKFHRIIRDVATIENKKVDLILEGTENEIDRNILKIMSDSLVHLVRNSVSHGIESPAERKKAGKPEEGKVILRARNEKDIVIIEVVDDGYGIDVQVIGKKAVEKGLITEAYFKRASDDELIMLIFEPGFSNAEAITEVSGRGVGMDVVKRATESIGGNIKVTTKIGEGSTVQLSLPSSMAVKGALLFELNKQEYAVALSYTEAVVSLTKSDIHKVSNGLMASYLGKTISIIFLNDLYDINGLSDLSKEGALHNTFDELDPTKKLDVLVTSYANRYVGFVVDKLLQQKEIVEKTLAPPIDRVDLISGATILGNGNVCLVLDVANIINTLFKEKKIV